MVVFTFNSSTQGTKAERSEFQASENYIVRPYLKNKQKVVHYKSITNLELPIH